MKVVTNQRWQEFIAGPVAQSQEDSYDQNPKFDLNTFVFSYHDHQLSEAEAASRPMFYRQFEETNTLNDFRPFEGKVKEFMKNQFDETAILIPKLIEISAEDEGIDAEVFYFELETQREVDEACVGALRDGVPWKFIFPDFLAFIIVYHDLNFGVYSLKSSKANLKQRIETFGLNIL